MQFWKFDSKSTIDLDPPKSAILSKFSVFSNFKSLQKSQIGSVLALAGLKRCELLRRIPKKIFVTIFHELRPAFQKNIPPPNLEVLESASLFVFHSLKFLTYCPNTIQSKVILPFVFPSLKLWTYFLTTIQLRKKSSICFPIPHKQKQHNQFDCQPLKTTTTTHRLKCPKHRSHQPNITFYKGLKLIEMEIQREK